MLVNLANIIVVDMISKKHTENGSYYYFLTVLLSAAQSYPVLQ
jgi:hypothetical protein